MAAATHAAAPPGPDGVAASTGGTEQEAPRHAVRRAAVAELATTHGEAVMGFCLRLLGDRTLAEEVVQQVFFEACRDYDRQAIRASRKAWLFGIANHRCLDMIKRRQRNARRFESDAEVASAVPDPSLGPNARVARAQLTAALEECLEAISADTRSTLLQRFQTGATYEELSRQLGVSADALQVRVSRALPVLRRCLESKGWTGE